MKNLPPTQQDIAQLLIAAAKLIADYRSEFRAVRYTIDDQNIDRLNDAIQPFLPAPKISREFDCARGFEVVL